MAGEALTVEFDADSKKFLSELQKLNLKLAKTATTGAKAGERIATGWSRVKGVIGGAIVALGAVRIGQGVVSAIRSSAQLADNFGKMSKRTGIGTDALQRLDFAAQLSGASIEDIEKSTRRMSDTITNAGRGMKTAKDALKEAGLAFDDLEGKSPEDQFIAVLEGISQIKDATKRTAAIEDIFGRSGTRLLPLLTKGKKGLQELLAEREKIGPILTPAQIAAAEEFNDSMLRVKTSLMGAFSGEVLNGVGDFAKKLNHMAETGELQRIGEALGTVAKTAGELATQKENLDAFATVLTTTASVAAALAKSFAAAQESATALFSTIAENKTGRELLLNENGKGARVLGAAAGGMGGQAAVQIWQAIQRVLEERLPEPA